MTVLDVYSDEAGNRILVDGPVGGHVRIRFTGRNYTLEVAAAANLGRLYIDFDCDNGLVRIGPSSGVPPLTAEIRVGQDSKVLIGRNVSTTSAVAMSATEGTTIDIGEDVMFASGNQVRADDGHPIFDVNTGRRVNVSTSIRIGNHVWVGRNAALLGGATVGDGAVIGLGAIVTGTIPNNCIAVGVPARVTRTDIAWERPHLSLIRPFYKPDASTVRRSKYWNRTVVQRRGPAGLPARTRRVLGRWRRRLTRRRQRAA